MEVENGVNACGDKSYFVAGEVAAQLCQTFPEFGDIVLGYITKVRRTERRERPTLYKLVPMIFTVYTAVAVRVMFLLTCRPRLSDPHSAPTPLPLPLPVLSLRRVPPLPKPATEESGRRDHRFQGNQSDARVRRIQVQRGSPERGRR